ncbi:MAG: TusE/DsrC/DsvC family sulfur relay protein [Chloroflexi bacterium]|nr:TusE/DsrC/DsvC family sulfur relay protein [Chloroflexota bacterium]
MATVDLTKVQFDAEGFMVNPDDWTPEIAEALAEEEGIAPLTDRHWEVINFVRKYYQEKGEPPTLRRITKLSGVSTKELYQLFPGGPAKKVARLAGLGKPKGCI